MNDKQKEILIGLMLGDGHLEKAKAGKNACLRITRKSADKKYLLEHAKIFANYGVKCKDRSIFDKRTNKTYFQSVLRTAVHSELTEYWKNWYPNFKKIVPQNLILTPLSLATWFADDGSIKIQKRIYDVKLATHSFTKEEVIHLKALLKTSFDLNFKMYEDKSGKVPHWTLRLTNKNEVRKFVKIIQNTFTKVMKRKSDIWNKNIDLLAEKYYPACKFCSSNQICKNGSSKGTQKYLCKKCKRQFAI
jgi:hypothetical protein